MLILEVVFYSLSIYIIFVLLGIVPFSIKELVHNIFPITYQVYWFMSTFIILYIFIPFINILLNGCDRNNHLLLIIISLFIFSIIGTFTNRLNYANEFVQFVMFYIIGAYSGKYNDNFFTNKKKNYIIFIVVTLFMISSVVLLDYINIYGIESFYFFKRTKITSIIFSISLFYLFRNFRTFNSKLINLISASVLGVYLIHENSLIVGVLWNKIIHVNDYIHSSYLFLHMFFCTVIIFIVCVFIDLIRRNTVEKLISCLYDKVVLK